MKPLILDSTPLIYLAKAGVLEFIRELPERVFISQEVYREVVEEGKKKGEVDALVVEGMVKKGTLKVKEIRKEHLLEKLRDSPLHLADIETLSLAREVDGIAIIDEELGREIADIEEIENRGSIFILFRFFRVSLIDKKKLRETIDKMLMEGWRCSIDLYAIILSEIEKL